MKINNYRKIYLIVNNYTAHFISYRLQAINLEREELRDSLSRYMKLKELKFDEIVLYGERWENAIADLNRKEAEEVDKKI